MQGAVARIESINTVRDANCCDEQTATGRLSHGGITHRANLIGVNNGENERHKDGD